MSPRLARALRLAHRWAGLALAGFLVIVGLTGALLAFYSELEELVSPRYYAAEQPHARLGMGELAERAMQIEPRAYVTGVYLREAGRAEVGVAPKEAGAVLPFDELLLDPYTGEELGRRTWGDITQGMTNLMPFIYRLHYELALGSTGIWVLGIAALLWVLDSVVGLLITLPIRRAHTVPASAGWWPRWGKAWVIRRGLSAWRLNFDLHRAGSLWLWAVLLVFAWSSVYMNLWDTVYTWSTRAVMDYRPYWAELTESRTPVIRPERAWTDVQAAAERVMADQAREHGFVVERPLKLRYYPEYGAYRYDVLSSRDVNERLGKTEVFFDAVSDEVQLVFLPSGQYAGNTVTSWLAALHMAQVFGLPYRIFVCVFGVLLAVISVTGFLIWWRRKRRHGGRAGGGFPEAQRPAA